MKSDVVVPHEDESSPHGEETILQPPPPPDFLDLTKPPKRVVRLSPFRHFTWIRQAFGTNGQYAQEVRIAVLTIVFAVAGGATGGIVAAVTQHYNQQPPPFTSATADPENAGASEQTVQANTSPVATTLSDVNMNREKARRSTENRARRRVAQRPDPHARFIEIYNDLDLDLDAAPPKKKHRKKDDVDY